jgi:hypothetical protein
METIFEFFSGLYGRSEKVENVIHAQQEVPQQQLENTAKDKECCVLTERSHRFDEAEAEYKRDCEGFRFKCNRWGDWLEISIARLSNNNHWYDTHHSSAINLKQVNSIQLVEGSKPDMRGVVTYKGTSTRDDNKELVWKVEPQYPDIPAGRPLFAPDISNVNSLSNYGYWSGEVRISFNTPNFPRPAEDDKIFFHGVGKIFTPAGIGAKVYKQILTAKDKLV